eukprot:scpid65230/ scgid4238/ 
MAKKYDNLAKDHDHHISKWQTSDVALWKFTRFLAGEVLVKQDMISLAELTVAGFIEGSGKLRVESKLPRGREYTDELWLKEMFNQWRVKGEASTEKLFQHLRTMHLPKCEEKIFGIKRALEMYVVESEPVPASDQSIGVPVSGADASDWTSPAQAAAGSSDAVAGAGHEIIYVDPNWSFDQDHRLCLIAHHSASWEILARGLKNAATGAPAFANAGNQIAELKKDCDSTKERMAKLLDDWQQLTKKHDKVIHLIQAFRDIGESSAANDLIAKSQKASPESSQPTSIAVAETGGPGYH